MTVDIDGIRKRTWRYWYEDGLSEIALGVLYLAVGGLFLADALLPKGPGHVFLSTLGLPAVLIGGAWLGRRAVQAAKERLTYPRTGYVRYPRPGGRRRLLSGTVAGLISALAVLLLRAAPSARAWLPGVLGLVIAASYLYVGQRFGLGRFLALAAFSAVAGVGASLAGLSMLEGSAAYFALAGTALVAGGAVTLRRYLRQSQLQPIGVVDEP